MLLHFDVGSSPDVTAENIYVLQSQENENHNEQNCQLVSLCRKILTSEYGHDVQSGQGYPIQANIIRECQ